MRPGWDEYFMTMAEGAARRGSCPRMQVGAVIIDSDHGIVATGYNGSPRGLPSCDEAGCLMINNRCERTLHAEVNAIIQAGRNGASTRGTIMYTTHRPCLRCTLHIIQAGISAIVYRDDYRSDSEGLVKEAISKGGMYMFRLREQGTLDTVVFPDSIRSA